MSYDLIAGKNVKDNAEANQIVAKYTEEKGKKRIHYGWVVASSGKPTTNAGEEDTRARKLNEDWIRMSTIKVDKETNGKIYISGGSCSERLRLHDPKKVSEKQDGNGYHIVEP